jgi:hypothetical protein
MIDTDKYEGHSTGWKHKINHSTYSIINDDGQKVASVPCYEECNKDSQLIADAPLLLEEVKRLREQLLQGVMYMHMACKQTKDGRIYNAEKFERQVREMIE